MKPFDLHGLKTCELASRPSKVFAEDLGTPLSVVRLEKLDGRKWFGRPRPEAIERELGLLLWINIYEQIIVLFLGRGAIPIEVRWIVRRHFDAGPAGEDRVLFRTTTAQHEVFHTVNFVHLGGMDVPIEHNDLQVLRV